MNHLIAPQVVQFWEEKVRSADLLYRLRFAIFVVSRDHDVKCAINNITSA